MSLPRQICRGRTYLVTRRCTQRRFLLLPKPIAKHVFFYCLALAQRATGVCIHVVVVMSNHYHLVITDPEGKLPLFVYILNKYVAKCMNTHYGRWENLWAAGAQPSYVHLADDDAKLEKSAYAIANPVEAELVSRSARWPGLLLWRPGNYKVRRPAVFFQQDGPTPASLKLEMTPLPLDGASRQREVMELLGQAASEREAAMRKRVKEAGRKFLGVRAVLLQNPEDHPHSAAPRRGLSPRLATRDKWRRVELLARLKSFADDYREARERWIGGDRGVLFPVGTYKLRVEFGVTCAET